MTLPDVMTNAESRQRLIDLSFSLYECVGDLLGDLTSMVDVKEQDLDDWLDRIETSTMNIEGDMKLLFPMLRKLYQ